MHGQSFWTRNIILLNCVGKRMLHLQSIAVDLANRMVGITSSVNTYKLLDV